MKSFEPNGLTNDSFGIREHTDFSDKQSDFTPSSCLLNKALVRYALTSKTFREMTQSAWTHSSWTNWSFPVRLTFELVIKDVSPWYPRKIRFISVYMIIIFPVLIDELDIRTSVHENGPIWIDWIPRIFRDPESMEISFLGLIPVIELLEIFKIDRIFFENSWIFSNKMVFETVFYMAFLAAWCRIDMLYMFRILVIHCIEWSLWPTTAHRGLGAITWFIDFTGVEIA